jgi:hypothetical protein
VIDVTDYGESLHEQFGRPKKDRRDLMEDVRQTVHPLGVDLWEDRLGVQAQVENLGESIWLVALASQRVHELVEATKPKPRKESEEQEFVREVTHAFEERKVKVERQHRLVGASGHSWRATLYVPTANSVLEPVIGQHMHSVNAIYTRFGDLRGANGYGLYSLIDDRSAEPDEDIGNLLVQVSSVLRWSRHDDWIATLSGGAAASE